MLRLVESGGQTLTGRPKGKNNVVELLPRPGEARVVYLAGRDTPLHSAFEPSNQANLSVPESSAITVLNKEPGTTIALSAPVTNIQETDPQAIIRRRAHAKQRLETARENHSGTETIAPHLALVSNTTEDETIIAALQRRVVQLRSQASPQHPNLIA